MLWWIMQVLGYLEPERSDCGMPCQAAPWLSFHGVPAIIMVPTLLSTLQCILGTHLDEIIILQV